MERSARQRRAQTTLETTKDGLEKEKEKEKEKDNKKEKEKEEEEKKRIRSVDCRCWSVTLAKFKKIAFRKAK